MNDAPKTPQLSETPLIRPGPQPPVSARVAALSRAEKYIFRSRLTAQDIEAAPALICRLAGLLSAADTHGEAAIAEAAVERLTVEIAGLRGENAALRTMIERISDVIAGRDG